MSLNIYIYIRLINLPFKFFIFPLFYIKGLRHSNQKHIVTYYSLYFMLSRVLFRTCIGSYVLAML